MRQIVKLFSKRKKRLRLSVSFFGSNLLPRNEPSSNSKVMSQDVFILGAGFSRAISPRMPVMADLLRCLKAHANYEPPSELKTHLEENFEQGLSFMLSGQPWLETWENIKLRSEFVRISRALGISLQQATYESARALLKEDYTWLKDLVEGWDRIRAGVITLNYDTLIEYAVGESVFKSDNPTVGLSASALYPIPLTDIRSRQHLVLGPETVPSFKLYKLHGSINWWYSGREQYAGEQIYFSPVARGFTKILEPDEKLEFNQMVADKTPLIIPPTLDKRPYFSHESLAQLWRGAANQIQHARRIFCLGYSMPSADVTMAHLLKSNVTHKGIPLWVVNDDASAEYQRHLGRILGDAFELNADYCRPDSIKSFARDYVRNQLN